MTRDDSMFTKLWATFSECGLYRYELGRIWDENLPVLGWCACNPSTADMKELDPTTWRVVDFSSRFGFGGFILGNAYGFKSTKPKGLWAAKDPVGPENDTYLDQIRRSTDGMVVAWGAIPKRDRVYDVTKVLRASAQPLWCLRMTTGPRPQPEHPLYLPADLTLQRWP